MACLVILVLGAGFAAVTAFFVRFEFKDALTVFALALPFAVLYGIGIWRGIFIRLLARR